MAEIPEHDKKMEEAKKVFAETYVKNLAARCSQPTERQQARIVFCYEWIMENGSGMFEMDQWGKVVPITAKVEAAMAEMKQALRAAFGE